MVELNWRFLSLVDFLLIFQIILMQILSGEIYLISILHALV